MAPGGRDEARKQAEAGIRNRRVALQLEARDPAYVASWTESGPVGDFFCTCGRSDCDEIISIALAEYDDVRAKPYRFIVAPGHATEADEVVDRRDQFDVVAVKPEYRDSAAQVVRAAALRPPLAAELICAACGYGVCAVSTPEACPMCRETRWERRPLGGTDSAAQNRDI